MLLLPLSLIPCGRIGLPKEAGIRRVGPKDPLHIVICYSCEVLSWRFTWVTAAWRISIWCRCCLCRASSSGAAYNGGGDRLIECELFLGLLFWLKGLFLCHQIWYNKFRIRTQSWSISFISHFSPFYLFSSSFSTFPSVSRQRGCARSGSRIFWNARHAFLTKRSIFLCAETPQLPQLP
jgi:hypothetical protein